MGDLQCCIEEGGALELCQLCTAIEDGSIECLRQKVDPRMPSRFRPSHPLGQQEEHY